MMPVFELLIEILATLAFAASGLIAGLRKRLDAVGVCMVSGLTAFGGGTLRDLLLDRRPLFWMEHHYWLWVLLALSMLSIAFVRSRHIDWTERAIQIPDALGLALFSILGTRIAAEADQPAIIAMLMGVISAIFGGVLRDIVCNEIPRAFSDHKPYAVFAFAGSALYLLLDAWSVGPLISFSVSFAGVAALRLMAIQFEWEIPAWRPE
jgi:uncharacterized membrane protein YeiH